MSFVQLFNSALEASLHFHILIPNGVFVPRGGDPDACPRFVEIDAPTNEEVATRLDQIIERVTAMLRRHGRLDDDVLDEEPEPHLLLAARPARGDGQPFVEEPLPPLCARKDGYSLHAGTAVHKNDRQGLEQLARYCLRPPLAQGRLTEADDGMLRYTMKRRFSDGRHVLRFEPRDFLLRLCALVPPRGFHMLRYAGIFSAHARGRHALTGRGMRDQPAAPAATPPHPQSAPPPSAPPAPGTTTASPRSSKEAVAQAPSGVRDLEAPDDPTRERRLAWSVLMRRSFGLDVLACPRCGERMELISAIEDRVVIDRILAHLGLPARAPPRGRPWSPQRALALDRSAADGVDPPSAFE